MPEESEVEHVDSEPLQARAQLPIQRQARMVAQRVKQIRYVKNVSKRGFTKGLKKKIGGVKKGHDISHKASAQVLGITYKRMMRNPAKTRRHFYRRIRSSMDRSVLTKRDKLYWSKGIKVLKRVGRKKATKKGDDLHLSRLFRLYANRNPKNLRNKPASENRAIGAYPHFNIEDDELSDDGEAINDALNYQLGEYSDDEYSDDEEQRVAHSYLQLEDNLGDTIHDTEDQVDYRKVGNDHIK